MGLGRRGISLLVSACVFFVSGWASADTATETGEEPPPDAAPEAAKEAAPPATESRWYGWQTLLAEAGLLGAGIALDAWPLALTGYAVAPAVVHWAHGHIGKGFGSLALRVGGPVVAGVTTAATTTLLTDDPDAGTIAGAGAVIIVAIGAIVIDHSVLAHERVPVVKPERTIAPTAAVTPSGATLGVLGTF